jgi:hypothetical protein
VTDRSQLERRWRESQTLEDELVWLKARVEAGEVTPSCLELAAFAGSDAARTMVEERRWRWPKLPPPDSIEQSLGPSDSRRWKLARSSSKDSAEQLLARAILVRLQEWGNEAVGRALSAVAHASLDRNADPEARRNALGGDRLLLDHGPAVELPPMDVQVMAVAAGLAWHGEDLVSSALAAEVAPWALGYSDPVRERVDRGDP